MPSGLGIQFQSFRPPARCKVPLISIIFPAFNRANYLQRCVECIRQQETDDYEIIVVDDGSSEDLGAVETDVDLFLRSDTTSVRRMPVTAVCLRAAEESSFSLTRTPSCAPAHSTNSRTSSMQIRRLPQLVAAARPTRLGRTCNTSPARHTTATAARRSFDIVLRMHVRRGSTTVTTWKRRFSRSDGSTSSTSADSTRTGATWARTATCVFDSRMLAIEWWRRWKPARSTTTWGSTSPMVFESSSIANASRSP